MDGIPVYAMLRIVELFLWEAEAMVLWLIWFICEKLCMCVSVLNEILKLKQNCHESNYLSSPVELRQY